jgi:hypothetical protein
MEDSKKSDKARKIKPRSLFLPSGHPVSDDSTDALRTSGKLKLNARLWNEVLDGHIGFGGFEERWEVLQAKCAALAIRPWCASLTPCARVCRQRMQDAEVVKEALLTSAVSRAVAYLQLRHANKPRPPGGYFAYFKKIGFALVYQAVCQDQVPLFSLPLSA